MECKNCHAQLEENAGFCSYCGARVIQERISFTFLFKEFLDKVLSVDNRLLKTFLHLFYKPEIVIESYINGVRKRYFNPLSYLLVSVTFAGIYFFFLKDIAAETVEAIPNTDSTNPFSNKEFTLNYMNFIFDYQAFVTAIIIPFYALISWIVFLNKRKYNFYEHMVIYLYGSAHLSIFTSILMLPVIFFSKDWAGNLSLATGIFIFLYFPFVLIRLFKLTFRQFLLKTLLFLAVLSGLYLLLTIIVVIATILFWGPDYFKQLDPSKQKQDSILKTQPTDSLQIPKIQNDDYDVKEEKTVSYYEASSKLNCLS